MVETFVRTIVWAIVEPFVETFVDFRGDVCRDICRDVRRNVHRDVLVELCVESFAELGRKDASVSIELDRATKWPAHYYVTCHVYVAEPKETAQVPPLLIYSYRKKVINYGGD